MFFCELKSFEYKIATDTLMHMKLRLFNPPTPSILFVRFASLSSGWAATTGSPGWTATTGSSGWAATTCSPGWAATTGSPGWAATMCSPGWAATTGSPGWAATTGSPGSAATTGELFDSRGNRCAAKTWSSSFDHQLDLFSVPKNRGNILVFLVLFILNLPSC